jgi:hypothetical protein
MRTRQHVPLYRHAGTDLIYMLTGRMGTAGIHYLARIGDALTVRAARPTTLVELPSLRHPVDRV